MSKVNNGLVKAYSRTTDKLLALWPAIISKEPNGYTVKFPLLGAESITFYPTAQAAAESLTGTGNDWVRVEVEWKK